MKNEDKSKVVIVDERIQALSEKFAAHGFYILGGYILLSTFIKLIFLDLNPVYFIDTFIVFLIACAYYTFRGVKSGLFLSAEQKQSKRRILKGIIVGAIFFGAFMTFINGSGKSFKEQIIEFLFYSIFWGFCMYLWDKWTTQKSKKNADKLAE